jgi:isopentenyl-diphosphate delta-isomerase
MAAAWNADQSQEDFMKSDMVIVLDENDGVVGPMDKYATHRWQGFEPPAVHRAFSVFLFNSKNELLLQQRASSKITFPDVWTNTCCSHPLYNESELEAEGEMGVRRAAIRKLDHELGIKPGTIKPEDFRFLTRCHYHAPYIPGYGPSPAGGDEAGWKGVEWGEHEIDYILFVKVDVELNPHPDEVRAVRYVPAQDLKKAMEEPGLHWSPWFRRIVAKLYDPWVEDVDATIANDTFVDGQIHRLSPWPATYGDSNAQDL